MARRDGHSESHEHEATQGWFRPEVLSLPAYVPGKPAPEGAIKLSSNENPFPPLPALQAAVAAAIGNVNRYPDMFGTGLIAELSRIHTWPEEGIVIGNGSTALIEKILQAVVTPGGEVVIPWRSFEAYPIAIQAAGGVAVKVPLTPAWAHDLQAMAKAITSRTRAVLLCSPNNPTGVALSHHDVARFLTQVPEYVPVLLDEAYIHFARIADPVRIKELLELYPNLIVLRTFSKAYGLAGLRCGYALTSAPMATGIRAISTPFGVNTLAQVAALTALHYRGLVEENVERIVAEREKLRCAVAAQGWSVPESQANFFWFALGEDSARFEELCLREGVIVRRFGNEGVRVSVGEAEGSLRVLRALEALR